MQVFEFHFNIKSREDVTYDSFIFEPENSHEKKLGSLYMVGQLSHLLPQNFQFIKNLAFYLKERYYDSFLLSPEQNFQKSLKDVNKFLEEITKKENVSWLGNLNFVALSLSTVWSKYNLSEQQEINFTKIGDIKILLLRDKKIIDIGQKLDIQEAELYPLKIFNSVVSGKLAVDDKIIIFTSDLFSFFEKTGLLKKISEVNTEKELKNVFNNKELKNIAGISLLIILSKGYKRKLSWPLKFKREKFQVNFILIFFAFFQKAFQKIKNIMWIKFYFVGDKFKLLIKHRNVIRILILIFLLMLGFFIFN